MSADFANEARVTARVRGRVQGVGFRFFARREASALGLRGFARNLSDGSVEVVAEGRRNDLELLVAALRRGPSAAEIDSVEVAWDAASGTFANFGVRH